MVVGVSASRLSKGMEPEEAEGEEAAIAEGTEEATKEEAAE
jgi:hypothetical protein